MLPTELSGPLGMITQIQFQSFTFIHVYKSVIELFSTAIFLLPLNQEGLSIYTSYNQKYVHLVHLSLPRKKCGLVS